MICLTTRKSGVAIYLERHIFSKICNELTISQSDAVVPTQGVDLWRFCHGDCETSAGKFYTNFSSLARNSITNRKFHIPICSGTISALVDKELRWRNGEMHAVFCFISPPTTFIFDKRVLASFANRE